MSISTNPSPVGEFQAHFGGPPGSCDAVAECEKWEKLCADLLTEREKLRAELAKTQRECRSYRKSLIHVMSKEFKADFDVELAFAHLDDKPTLDELLAELEHAPGEISMLYKVAEYPGVAEQIRALIEHAAFSGIRGIVVAALKEMVLHLRTHPLDWGDPDHGTSLPGGVIYHAVLDPIVIRYAIFEEKKVVFIKEIKPLPGLPFDRE